MSQITTKTNIMTTTKLTLDQKVSAKLLNVNLEKRYKMAICLNKNLN